MTKTLDYVKNIEKLQRKQLIPDLDEAWTTIKVPSQDWYFVLNDSSWELQLITGQVKIPNLQHAIYECWKSNANATWK